MCPMATHDEHLPFNGKFEVDGVYFDMSCAWGS